MMAAAWLSGAGGTKRYLRTGKSASDANGTDVRKYINMYRGALGIKKDTSKVHNPLPKFNANDYMSAVK